MSLMELLPTTTVACAVGIMVAEGARVVFGRMFNARTSSKSSPYWPHFNEFVNTTISAFILVNCTFEKGLLLMADLPRTFFIFTFFLFIVYCFVFSTYSPSPFTPLVNHWPKIKGEISSFENRNLQNAASGILSRTTRPITMYFKYSVGTLLGLVAGLQFGIWWLKFFWNGWLTGNHVTQLPVLDDCMDCLNTNLFVGLLLEAGVTFCYCIYFSYVDENIGPQAGSAAPFSTKLARNFTKAISVVLFTYLFMDVTGAFANPFLAYALQRNCLNDVTKILNFVVVYVGGPLLGTIGYNLLRENTKEAKYSV